MLGETLPPMGSDGSAGSRLRFQTTEAGRQPIIVFQVGPCEPIAAPFQFALPVVLARVDPG